MLDNQKRRRITMKTKKSLRILVCILISMSLLFTIIFSGCGQKQSPGSGDVSNTKTETTTQAKPELKGEFISWGWAPAWDAVAADFNKVYPDIKFVRVPVDGKDYLMKLTTSLAAGTDLPDMGSMEMSVRGTMINMDVWEDLEVAPYNLKRDEMLDFLIPLCSNPKGKIVGVECGPSPAGMAYRRDLAKEYFGTDDPKELEKMFSSWDEFINKGIEVKQKSGGKVFMMTGPGDVSQMMREQSDAPRVEGTTLKIKETLLDDFRLIVKMRDGGIIDKLDPWSPAWNASYSTGKYIFYPCAPWSPTFTIKPNDKEGSGKWGLMMPPRGSYNWGGTLYSIPKEAKNKLNAWTFINWSLYTKDGAKSVRDRIQFLSPYKPVYEDKEFYNIKDDYFGGQSLPNIFGELAFKVKARALTKYDSILNDAILLGLKGLNSGMSPEDTVKTIEDESMRKSTELKVN